MLQIFSVIKFIKHYKENVIMLQYQNNVLMQLSKTIYEHNCFLNWKEITMIFFYYVVTYNYIIWQHITNVDYETQHYTE